MSHLSEELERQLGAVGLSVDDVAERSGISRGQIYLWKRGDQTSISESQMTSLAKALTRDKPTQAQLVRAHLMDERFGPGAELVRIEIDHVDAAADKPRRRSKREISLAYLTELSLNSRDCNDLVIDLARCLGAEV